MTRSAPVAERRIAISASGALSGLAAWFLIDLLPDAVGDARLRLGLVSGLAAFFFTVLACLGPLRTPRAIAAGLAIGLPIGLLMPTASLRFDTVNAFLESGHPIAALVILIVLPIPYLLAGLGRHGDFLRYETLFDAAWQMVVRASAAVAFTGVFWGLVWLSDVLFGLVGLDIIETVLDIDWVPYVFTGASFGLALAVAHELSDYVSPHLPLRLLRLLLPFVLGVTAIFLVFLPFRGLSGLFGDFSAAGTLMALALAAATLVSAALDRNDDAAVEGFLLKATAGMAALLPVLALLAVLAVVERVGQYGWTPNRLAAATGSALLSLYGAAYLAAVLRRANWSHRIRRTNALLALVVLGAAALWISPVFNPQRIAAQSQVERFASGRVGADALDLWTIGREWGRPGEAAIERLAAMGDADLDARIAFLEDAASRYAFEAEALPATAAQMLATIEGAMAIRPDGAVLPPDTLEVRGPGELQRWHEACQRRTPAGNSGCAALVADLVPGEPGEEVVLFFLISTGYTQLVPVFEADRRSRERTYRDPHPMTGALSRFTGEDAIDLLIAGEITVAPRSLNVLKAGDAELVVLP